MKKNIIITMILFVLFAAFTAVVVNVNLQPIGPNNSVVGLATMNSWVLANVGSHEMGYFISKQLGNFELLLAGAFAVLGLIQLIQRKSLRKVDSSLLILGAFYLLVFGLNYLFENVFIINYRPIIRNGELQASYPSSHTLLSVCIMGTAILQFIERIKPRKLCLGLNICSAIIMVATIVGRLYSGVHWASDIIGGILLGSTLVMLYATVVSYFEAKSIIEKQAKIC